MWVPVCMFVLTSTVLLRSRWWVVMSVTSIDANWGQVGMRSPQGWVRSTIRTRRLLKHAHPGAMVINQRLSDEGHVPARAGRAARALPTAAQHAAFPKLHR